MRKLVAALACRSGGTRLYGKPLQNLRPGTTILDQILDTLARLEEIDASALAIAEGRENSIYTEIAERRGLPHIVGSEKDVLYRLIECGRHACATDVFRMTTECPFFLFEALPDVWRRHRERGNDITVIDPLPEGTNFEIYRLEALEHSHRNGQDEHRSEMCSWYARQNADEFAIDVVAPPALLQRTDLRLTVDYPEDLILCREVYRAFEQSAPLIPLEKIIEFVDEHPELQSLVSPFVAAPKFPWRATIPAPEEVRPS